MHMSLPGVRVIHFLCPSGGGRKDSICQHQCKKSFSLLRTSALILRHRLFFLRIAHSFPSYCAASQLDPHL